MADVASLAVGLHLNAASFKSQLLGAYGDAENQSRRFNRNAQADAKKTEDAYKKVGLSISGMASRLAGLAGAGLSIGTIVTTSRQYGQALSDLQAITGATAAEMKALDLAAQEMGRTTEYSASQAAEALKLMASAKPELLKRPMDCRRLRTARLSSGAGRRHNAARCDQNAGALLKPVRASAQGGGSLYQRASRRREVRVVGDCGYSGRH